MVAVGLGLASCSEDRDPVYQVPGEFVLNTPALQDQYYQLSEDNTFDLTCSQPDYGYAAVAHYSLQVSLTQGFSQFETINPIEGGTSARMVFQDADLAMALCALHGFTSEDNYQDLPAEPVYLRAVCELPNVATSRIVSNVVYLKHVKFYYAVPTPGYIYCIGSCFGNWTEPSEGNKEALKPYRLYEADNAIGSEIYKGTFEIPAGDIAFRFYSKLTGWDGGDSYGVQVEDATVPCSLTDGVFTSPIVKGKGGMQFATWPGGQMSITVNLKEMTVTVAQGGPVAEPRYVYMVGNNAGWAEPSAANKDVYDQWRLTDPNESGVYTGTFDIAEQPDGLYFRIYPDLAGWGSTPYAADTDGSVNVDMAFNTPLPYFTGEGCWTIKPFEAQKVTVTLDTNSQTVKVTKE